MTEGDRSSRLEAIILAGGAGTRFGGAKLTSPWRGAPLIHGALATAFAAPVRWVTVVTGADAAVRPVVEAWAAARDETARLRVVHATDHARGMAASLRAGLAALDDDTSGAFVFLGDMPLIPVSVVRALAAAFGRGAEAAAPLFEGERGHPVLFGRSLFAALGQLDGDVGGRALLAQLTAGPALVETDEGGVLFDVDVRLPSPQDRHRYPSGD